MFTGIVEEIGRIRSIDRGAHSAVLTVEAKKVLDAIHLGDSIAVSGVCLTVTAFTDQYFRADVMHETLNRSSLAGLQSGASVNLERAMAADGRFGGHIVAGHVDGVGHIRRIQKDDNAIRYTLEAGPEILRLVVEKGSITMDGISLTVTNVSSRDFSVSVIPHTARVTTLGEKKVGDPMNLETDIIGKYVEKLMRPENPDTGKSGVTIELLTRYGF